MSQDNVQNAAPQSNLDKKLDGFFKISERGSTVKTEMIAGLTTFLAMVYSVINGVMGKSSNGDWVCYLINGVYRVQFGPWSRRQYSCCTWCGIHHGCAVYSYYGNRYSSVDLE